MIHDLPVRLHTTLVAEISQSRIEFGVLCGVWREVGTQRTPLSCRGWSANEPTKWTPRALASHETRPRLAPARSAQCPQWTISHATKVSCWYGPRVLWAVEIGAQLTSTIKAYSSRPGDGSQRKSPGASRMTSEQHHLSLQPAAAQTYRSQVCLE